MQSSWFGYFMTFSRDCIVSIVDCFGEPVEAPTKCGENFQFYSLR
jgi:hypothetical protein